MKSKRAQSEMVGFILIVAIVIIVMLVFFIISVKKPRAELKDVQVENMLSAIMEYTTKCTPNDFVPDYQNMEDLIVDCANGDKCNNLDKMACDYLNETSESVLSDLIKTENGIVAYRFKIYRNESSDEPFVNLREGNCTGELRGAPPRHLPGETIVELSFCYSD
jgi:hypothetical protein